MQPAILAVVSLAAAFTVTCAHAECGDVNGDGSVTTADALRTLRKSVGQQVQMTCDVADSPINGLAYSNFVTCNDADPHATLAWSEHPGLSWKTNLATEHPFLHSDFQRIDDLYMQGRLTATFGSCGPVSLDLDAANIAFPLPNHAGVSAQTFYEASDNTVYFYLSLHPVSTEASLVYGEVGEPVSVHIGSVPAPAGLSGISY